jgi:hypothetical protein
MLRLFEADLLVKNVVAVIGSICDALYKCSFQDISDTNRIQNIGSDLVSKLVSRLATDKEATDVLVSVIRNSQDVVFASLLNRRARLAEKGYDDTSFNYRKPNVRQCQDAFDVLVEQKLLRPDVDLFGFPRDTWFLAVSDYSNKEKMKKAVLSHLQKSPEKCLLWLSCWFQTSPSSIDKFFFVPPAAELVNNASKIPLLNETYKIMSESLVDKELDERDRTLAVGFKDWYKNLPPPAKELPSKT